MATPSELLEMSDEDFNKLMSPPSADAPSDETVEGAAEPATLGSEVEATPEEAAAPAAEQPPVEKAPVLEDPSRKDAFKADPKPAAQEVKDLSTEKAPAPKEDPLPAPATTDNYKAFFDKVMAPFRANGRMMQLRDADEVISLMQKGANYTKKSQELQASKKFLMMLENNDLLNEEKLAFLIDLHQRNPEAIKKLMKDANLDPVEMDMNEVKYQQGSHKVTDQEVAFKGAIGEITSLEGGRETLQSVHGWDEASKAELWKKPGLLEIIHNHHQTGVYAMIGEEIERRKILGKLPASTSFLQAYETVGNEMQARGAFGSPVQSQQTPQKTAGNGAPPVIRPAVKTPLPPKASDSKVRAAAPTRTTTGRLAQPTTNYLSMSDEEFLQQPVPRHKG